MTVSNREARRAIERTTLGKSAAVKAYIRAGIIQPPSAKFPETAPENIERQHARFVKRRAKNKRSKAARKIGRSK